MRAIVLMLLITLVACTDTRTHARAVFVLLDTSGTYAQEIGKAQKIIDYLLAVLNPGDTLAVARIDSASFSEKDVIASLTFNQRPSMANAEKRAFHETINQFAASVTSSGHTDISGGLLQAVQYLEETGAGQRYVLIFSDLQEDLQQGHVRQFDYDFTGTHVVAMNVTKLASDTVDPRGYLARLDEWQSKVTGGGGSWRVINDLAHLDRLFAS